jgi:hypothetical protein
MMFDDTIKHHKVSGVQSQTRRKSAALTVREGTVEEGTVEDRTTTSASVQEMRMRMYGYDEVIRQNQTIGLYHASLVHAIGSSASTDCGAVG